MSKCQHLFNVKNVVGQIISMEECRRCYTNYYNKNGIDYCLICLQAFCLEHPFNHSKKHREIKEYEKHSIYLNVKCNTEGLSYYLFCYECNTEIPKDVSLLIKENIEYIINYKGNHNENKNLISQVNHCEHTLTFTNEVPFFHSDSKEKDICLVNTCTRNNKDLWICYHCGFIGCGKSQYDNTGGNDHYYEHSLCNSHPLAIRLNTLSIDNKISLKCLSCNMDVSVDSNSLSIRANELGILKSLNEINFTSSDYQKAIGPGLVGLVETPKYHNLNSILQVIFSLELITKRYYSDSFEHLVNCKVNNANDCFLCQVSKFSFGINSGNYQLINSIDLVNFLTIENFINNESSLLHIFNSIVNRLDELNKSTFDSNLMLHFSFDISIKSKCSICNYYNITKENINYLTLSTSYWKTRLEYNDDCSFEEFAKFWTSYENNQYCNICFKTTKFQIKRRIENLPLYLLIILENTDTEWINSKPNINLTINDYDRIDFSLFLAHFDDEDGKIFDKKEITSSIAKKIKFEDEKLTILLSMGISVIEAKNSLFSCNNNEDEAIDWYFNNMDHKDLNIPLYVEEAEEINETTEVIVDNNLLQPILEFGFSSIQAKGALIKFNNNIDNSIDFLLSHSDYDFSSILKNNKVTGSSQNLGCLNDYKLYYKMSLEGKIII